MTQYDNTSGNLNRKILLSGVYDPDRPDTDHRFLEKAPTGIFSTYNVATAPVSTEFFTEYGSPKHWQDTISDYTMQKNVGRQAVAGAGTTETDKRSTADLTVANEFELDVNSLTHNFQTMTAIGPLPGIPRRNLSDIRSTYQLNALSIDLGMMREVIAVQGFLVDRVGHPSSTSGHHMRRQHLLDIVRSQYGFIHGLSKGGKDISMINVNRFPALTIGPMYGRTAGNDQDYEGDQPSDDVRGYEIKGSTNSYQRNHASTNGKSVKSSWSPTPTYKGRQRYRGLIIRCSVQNQGGRPDIWQYSFEFVVIKNEMQMRLSSNEDVTLAFGLAAKSFEAPPDG